MTTDKIVLMLMGPSGCGKSTLEKGLCAHGPVKKAVSVTTRERREGEVDGVDYHFIHWHLFQAMEMQNELIQTTQFGGHNYGTATAEYTTKHNVVTLCCVPESAVIFKQTLAEKLPNCRVLSVYFDISQERLMLNMQSRGDTPSMIHNRTSVDNIKQQFADSGIVPDYIITDETLNEHTLAKVCLWLAKQPETEENG